MNLMIVEKKVRMARSEGGRNLEIFVVPYTGLSASMGALIATPKDDFSEVRGIYYSGSWSICSPVATSPDVHRFETFLGPDRETPIQRVSLMGAMPYHRDGLTTENGWHCERPSLNKEASINSLNELPLATDGFDEAAADAIMETEGQFARRKSKLLWLPRDAFEKHGMSVDEYIDSIVPFEKLLTKRKVRPIRQRKTRAATKRRDR